MKSKADRSSGVLRVVCLYCEAVNEFPDFAEVEVFTCQKCNEPVEVEELTQ
jgi:hypothetical protein